MFELPSLVSSSGKKRIFPHVYVPKNHLAPDEILLLTRSRDASAFGVLLLDTVVRLTSEVSSHKLPRAQVRTQHMGEGRGQAYTALCL